MNIDQLVEEIAARDMKEGLEVLQQFVFELSAAYGDGGKQIDVLTFVQFFLKRVEQTGIDALAIVVSLLDLYQDLKAKSNQGQVYLKDITSYVVDHFDSVGSQAFHPKFLPKSDAPYRPGRQLIDAEISPPQILGLDPSQLRRVEHVYQIMAVPLQNKNLVQVELGHRNAEMFFLYQFDESIQHYRGFQCCKAIRAGNSQQHQGNFILQISWAQKQQRLGALMRNFQLCFWDRRDNYQFSLLITTNCNIKSLKYLTLHDCWITVGSKPAIQIWDLGTGEAQEISNPLLESGISQIVEVHHLQMVIIASAPSTISCWDMYEQKMLFKFTTSHQTITTILSSSSFQLLFTVGFDNFISCYQLHTQYNDQNLVCKLQGHTTTINCMSLIEGTCMLASVDCKNIVILWDIRSRAQHQVINLATRIMCTQIFCYNDKLCLVNSKFAWLPFEPRELGQKACKLLSIIYDSWNKRNIIVTRMDLRIQDINTGKIEYILSDFRDEISAACLTEHGQSIMIGSAEGDLLKVSIKSGEVLQKWEQLMSQEIVKITLDEQAQLLHILSEDSSLKCIPLLQLNVRKDDVVAKDKRAVRQLIHNNQVNYCSISIFHGLLAISFDNYIQIWNLEYYSVISQVQMDGSAQTTTSKFCDKIPILIFATNAGDVYFLKVQQRNEQYFCQIEGYLNIVKSTLVQKIRQKQASKGNRAQVMSDLFALSSQQLLEMYDGEDEDIQVEKLKEKKFKLSTMGNHVVSILVDMREQNRILLYLASNKGVLLKFDVSKLLEKESISLVEPIYQRPNYNPYRVIYNNYEEHFIENYKIVQGRLVKDYKYKTEMKIANNKIKQKFRMSMIRLTALKGLKDSIEPDITQPLLDPIYGLDDTLLQLKKIHDTAISQISFIQVDAFEVLFQKQSMQILTCSVEDIVKIFSVDLELKCQFNLHHPTPQVWSVLSKGENKLKSQVLFAIELLQKLAPSLPPAKQAQFSIQGILKMAMVQQKVNNQRQKQLSLPVQQSSPDLISLPSVSTQSQVSLKFYNEKMKYMRQQRDIQHQERLSELNSQRRSKAQQNEQYKLQKKEVLEYFTDNIKDNKSDDGGAFDQVDSRDLPLRELLRWRTDAHAKTFTNLNQASKISRTTNTNFTETNNKRLTTESSKQSQDFFEYAESKDFITTCRNERFNPKSKARLQHKEFHNIITQLHGKLKVFKSK